MKENNSMKFPYPLGFGEEVSNSISHGVMALLLLFMLPYYSIRAYLQGGTIQAIAISIYIICLLFMFGGSCLYHCMPHNTTHKYVFRKLDHIMILLAIAGTYTPICLILMHNTKGYIILTLEWIMAIAGVLLKSIAKKCTSCFIHVYLYDHGMVSHLCRTYFTFKIKFCLYVIYHFRRTSLYYRCFLLFKTAKKIFPFCMAYTHNPC
jgi:channel protein (hemolysin III family)